MNPETGSVPPPEMAWAVFAHGTAFFSAPDDRLGVSAGVDDVAEAARAALAGLGPVVPGGPGGDFSADRLSGWFPDEPVWFIGFGAGGIATVVVEDLDDLRAGLTGRALRDRDHESMRLVAVRNFRGERAEG
ncbi:hypothetical protein [Catenuloplanes japonicus]|uniref:hypothetical protein n=1 Tax=Catenuloplanes japonicus TaxID=33876 RepID=UPI00052795B8|nr:hypothetical protein [Catenuloplanes japonicus]